LSNAEAKNIELNGKAVLVTGASSGIGRSIAETLASNGAFVYAGARKQKDIDELSQIKNIVGIRLDVTKANEIVAAVELVKKEGRGLYGLVNNAGVFFHAPLIEVADSEMQFMMNVNVFGPYRVTKAFSPLIIESKGRISNIS
jgi:NAD(P)-dependent dehydrogenase (short-subunit alcohol dehydrogenase family)